MKTKQNIRSGGRMKIKNLIYIFLIISFSILLISKLGVFIGTADEAAHALAAFTYSDVAKWWLVNPTFSMGEIMDHVNQHQALYKAIGAMRTWPPLSHWIMAFFIFIGGKSLFILRIPGLLESVVILLLTYLITLELFGKDRIKMALIASIFVLLNPVFFYYGPKIGLDVLSTVFYTATFYFLLLFMKTDKKKFFYLMSICLALAIMSKVIMVLLIPLIIISLLIEKRDMFSFKNTKPIIISLILLFVALSPYIVMEFTFNSIGLQGPIGNAVAAAPFRGNDTIHTQDPFIYTKGTIGVYFPVPKFTVSVSTIFYYLILLPFFIISLIRWPKKTKGFWSSVIFSLSLIAFFTFFAHVEPRYLLPVIPIATILAVRGLFEIKNYKIFKPLLLIIMIAMAFLTYDYVSFMNKYDGGTYEKFQETADYMISNTDEPSSVILFRREYMGFVLSMKNSTNLYVMKPAHFKRGGSEIEINYTDEEELSIMLDSKDYVRKPSKPSWDEMEIKHPPVQWVIVPESQLFLEKYNFETGRNIKEFMDDRDDFELIMTINNTFPKNISLDPKNTFFYTSNKIYVYKKSL